MTFTSARDARKALARQRGKLYFLSVVLSGIRHWASRFSADRTLLHPRFPLISFMR